MAVNATHESQRRLEPKLSDSSDVLRFLEPGIDSKLICEELGGMA